MKTVCDGWPVFSQTMRRTRKPRSQAFGELITLAAVFVGLCGGDIWYQEFWNRKTYIIVSTYL